MGRNPPGPFVEIFLLVQEDNFAKITETAGGARERGGTMARRIHRGMEFFGKTKKLFQDRGGAIHQDAASFPVDGFPRYDLETPQSPESREKLLKESLGIALKVLQTERVLPLADLAHRIVEELMVNPNYTYRELLMAMKADPRFSVTSGQIISLPSVENPADIFFRRIAQMKKGRRGR
jgi:hypothetical protein